MKIHPAPTGLHEKAQGIALGEEDIRETRALKGRNDGQSHT